MTELIPNARKISASASTRTDGANVMGLFNPKSVAVVGASANPDRFSGKIIPSMVRQGYTGAIYPVNPKRERIASLPCYRDLSSIPGDIDCVIYALAAEHIGGTLDQCVDKGVKLLVVSSAGFAERGDALGIKRQAKLVERANGLGMRVLGPNCIGFVNFVDRVCVSSAAVLAWPNIPAGNVGLVSQSGGLGLATALYSALAEGISYSSIITTGNEADLSTIDVARALLADSHTDSIGLTIEAVKDPDDFRAFLAEAMTAGKPIVVLKSGKTALGKTMAASHTGALAGSSEVFESVCREYGATCANDIDDFYQFASMFARLRRADKLKTLHKPASACSALSISGGHIGLLADHASLQGMEFPAFSQSTQHRISDELGFAGNYRNPLDTTARTIGDDGFWGRCVQALLDDQSIEVVMPIITVAKSYEKAALDFANLAKSSRKAIIVVWAGGDFEGKARKIFSESCIPVFGTTARAAAAIRALDRYCCVLDRLRSQAEDALDKRVKPNALGKIRKVLEEAVSAGRKTLSESESKKLLEWLGFCVTREVSVANLGDALDAAKTIGYPLALKADHPDILHKSDLGLVYLGVQSEEDLRLAYKKLVHGMGQATRTSGRVLVQEYVEKGLELIVGVNRDAEFGPTLLLGLGGIFVETLKDTTVRTAPLDTSTAQRMMNELRCATLLDGQRGQPGINRSELARLLVAIGDLASGLQDLVQEIDINPLAFDIARKRLVALDALITLRGAQPAAHIL